MFIKYATITILAKRCHRMTFTKENEKEERMRRREVGEKGKRERGGQKGHPCAGDFEERGESFG